jgi:hypothetical protein
MREKEIGSKVIGRCRTRREGACYDGTKEVSIGLPLRCAEGIVGDQTAGVLGVGHAASWMTWCAAGI